MVDAPTPATTPTFEGPRRRLPVPGSPQVPTESGVTERFYLRLISAVLLSALVVASPALAGRGHRNSSTAPTTVTATVTGAQVSLSGCGFVVEPVQAVYMKPDGTTETWYIGIFNDNNVACLDNNYIFVTEAGSWSVTLYQEGLPVASTTFEVTG